MRTMRVVVVTLSVFVTAALSAAENEALRRGVQLNGSSFHAQWPGSALFPLIPGDNAPSIDHATWLRWGVPAEPPPGTRIVLHNGSVLVAELTELTAEEIRFVSARRPGMWRANRLPRSLVRAIWFSGNWSPAVRESEEHALFDRAGENGLVALVSGDVIAAIAEFGSETASAETGSQFVLTVRGATGEPLRVTRERIRGLIFPAATTPGDTNGLKADDTREGLWLGLVDGSCVLVVDMKSSAQEVVLTLPGGQELVAQSEESLPIRPQSFAARVCFLERSPVSGWRYLSDLPPLGYKHVPLLDRELPYTLDRSRHGSCLRVRGERYRKGIQMPATSRLAFDLPSGMRQFVAELALDDTAGKAASVTFRLFLESPETPWQAVAEEAVRSGDAPRTMQVPLGNATRLALVVEMGERSDLHDVANWLHARLLP